MYINSINPTMNYYNAKAKYLRQTNFKSRTGLNNLDKWVKQNGIAEKTMKSFEELVDYQQKRAGLQNKSNNLIPKISSTKHIINYECTDSKGKPIDYVVQTVDIKKDNKLLGHYDVHYNKKGEIIDSYLISVR